MMRVSCIAAPVVMCPVGEGQLPKSKSEELLPKDVEIDIWHRRIQRAIQPYSPFSW